MRAAQARSQQEASELGARLAGERDAARASLTTVYRPEWWDAAQPDDIARAYQTARAWGDVDPEAVRAEQRIAQELRDRYGVELPEQVASNPASVREALNSAEEARNTIAGEMAAAERDVVEGVGLIAQADAIDAAADELDQRVHDLLSDHADRVDEFESPPAADAEQLVDPTPAREPDPARQAEADQLTETAHDMRGDAQQLDDRGQVAYDSADRRRAMAAGMEGKASAATVDARVTADVAQAKPATEATRMEQRPRPESPPQPVPGQPGGPEGHHPLGIDPLARGGPTPPPWPPRRRASRSGTQSSGNRSRGAGPRSGHQRLQPRPVLIGQHRRSRHADTWHPTLPLC